MYSVHAKEFRRKIMNHYEKCDKAFSPNPIVIIYSLLSLPCRFSLSHRFYLSAFRSISFAVTNCLNIVFLAQKCSTILLHCMEAAFWQPSLRGLFLHISYSHASPYGLLLFPCNADSTVYNVHCTLQFSQNFSQTHTHTQTRVYASRTTFSDNFREISW